jgi:hypothetical protein
MRSAAVSVLCVSAVVLSAAINGGAQQRPAAANDPRIGLKAGLHDAGEAARNMEKVSSLGKPAGFFDPKAPAGTPTPPERDPNLPPEPEPTAAAAGQPAGTPPEGAQPAPGAAGRGQAPSGLSFANSDLAFSKNHVFMGNFHGFTTYDIDSTKHPRVLATVVCPGGQGDVSVHGNLLFMSVEQTRGRVDCGTEGVKETASAERFRGVRIFDISDISKPRQIAAIQTCRGSHTHTLVTDPKDKANLYVYGSGTSTVRPGEELAGCSARIRTRTRTRRSSAST